MAGQMTINQALVSLDKYLQLASDYECHGGGYPSINDLSSAIAAFNFIQSAVLPHPQSNKEGE